MLGRTIHGDGFAEVEDAVTWLCRQPATARHVSARLATYFVADEPPAALVSAMAATFERTGGSIAAVLREMFLHPAFLAGLGEDAGGKFKDPMQFVVSSLRLADDRPSDHQSSGRRCAGSRRSGSRSTAGSRPTAIR